VEPALAAALSRAPDGESSGRAVLVVDQFEELAAAHPDAARELLGLVGELVTGTEPISAVLTLRSATLDEVLVPELAGLLGAGTVLVPPMQRGQLRDAIVAPAERAPGLSFEAGLVDRILDDAAAEPGQLPLVESLLTELWSRRDGGYLTVRAYEDAGGVAGVIATHAEAVLAGFTDADDATRLRRLLTSLASPRRDGGFARISLPWTDVAPDLRPVVHRLAAGRLVVVARSSTGTEHVQLAHQALIAHWPRLREWLTEDRDFLAWRAQLDQQRERWEDTARDDGALLRGTPLSAALDWLPARSVDVSEAGREYVRRSQARQRREVRRWRLVTAVLTVLVLAAGTLSVIAVTRGNRINDQLRLANAELVAQTALAQAGVDPVAATRLALTAWHLDPDNGSARTALVNQYLAMRSVEATFPDVSGNGLDSIVVAPDGTDRVLVRNGRSLALIDSLATGRPERWDVPLPAEFRTAGLIDNGKTLIALASNGDVLRWDIATRSGPDRTPTGITPPGFASVQMDPAATKVGWIQQVSPGVHALELRDARTSAVVPHRIDPIADPGGVGFELPVDPNLVVLQPGFDSTNLGPLIVRSLADGAERASFPPGSVTTSAVDGTVLSCEQDGSVAVLRALADGAEIRRFALLGGCSGEWPLLLTSDGDHLLEVTASTGDSGSRTVRITRLGDGQAYGLALPPDTRNALNPRFGIPMVVVGSDASPAVLLAHGESVLRLRARPVPANPKVTLWPVDDERYLVAFEQGRTIVMDRELRRLAELTDEQAGTNTDSRSYAVSGLAVVTPPPQGWTISDFALPSLDRISIHRLEAPTTGRGPQVVVTKDRIVSMSRRVVTAWDRATGAQLYEPTRLPEADFRDTAHFAIRPGHPDEIMVIKGLGAEIWDLRQRRRVADVPLIGSLQPTALAFFPSGDRVVAHALGSNLEIRNLADLQPVRPAFPAPGTTALLGVTQDNHILTLRDDADFQFVFWDAERGSVSGTFTLPRMYRPSDLTEDGRQIRINAVNSGVPFHMPVTAQQWAERLCTIADQPFTEKDRALLPEGVEVDRPCTTG
jgi:conflict system STAND superfamily ATPase